MMFKRGEDDGKHIILKHLETKKWREEYVNSNWLNMNEDLVYKKIISCISVNRIKAYTRTPSLLSLFGPTFDHDLAQGHTSLISQGYTGEMVRWVGVLTSVR
jgi:hypothetical protein